MCGTDYFGYFVWVTSYYYNQCIIRTDKYCFGIEFCDNIISTVCDKQSCCSNSFSIYTISTDGIILKVIQTNIVTDELSYLAVISGNMLLTDQE